MAKKVLPIDQNGFPINILKLGVTSSPLTVTDSTSRIAFPSGIAAKDCIRISCNTDCYIAVGGSGVTASTSDILFLSGVEYVSVAPGQTHLAAVRVGIDGILTITEVF